MFYKTKTTLAPINQKKNYPMLLKKKKNQPTSHEKINIKNPTETQLQLPKKKPSHFIFYLLPLPNVVECI